MNRKQNLPPVSHTVGPAAPQAAPPARLVAAGDGFPRGDAPLPAAGSGLAGLSRIVARHRATLLFLSVAGAAVGLLFALAQTPVYRATTSLEVQGLNEAFLNMAAVSPIRGGGGAPSPWEIPTEAAILGSQGLIDRTLARLQFQPAPEQASPLARWKRDLGLADGPAAAPRDTALSLAAISLAVRAPGETRILELATDSSDPDIAAGFLNTLADLYIEENLAARWETTRRTEKWLDRQLAELRERLQASEESLQGYARASGLMFVSAQESVSEERLRQLQRELSHVSGERIAKQSAFEMTAGAEAESLPTVLDAGPLRQYQLSLTDLKRQHAELNSTFTPAHHQVKRLAAQIDEMKAAIKHERGAVIERISNDYEAALRRETLLADDYARQSQIVSEHAVKSIRYNILKREVETNRELYDGLLKKVKETGVASALSASAVRIVDRARPAVEPYKPNHVLLTMMGLFAGLFAGVAMAWVREATDNTIRVPGDALGCLRTPELGAIPCVGPIPWLGSPQRPVRLRIRYARGRGGSLRPRRLAAPDAPHPDNLLPERSVEQAGNPILKESFRATLTSLLFASRWFEPCPVLVVTSPSPEEGKTTVTCNLAISLAQVQRRVLLVDGDLHRPRLHNVFGVDDSLGLSSLLRDAREIDRSPVDAVAHPAVRATGVPGLYVLPSGPASEQASNLLHGPRVSQLLSALRRQFDVILIDTPPIMPIADARIIGRHADGVILVLRAGSTKREAARAAEDRLTADGSRVLGTVLNRWVVSGQHDYYYAPDPRATFVPESQHTRAAATGA